MAWCKKMKDWSRMIKSAGKYGIAYLLLIVVYLFAEKIQWLDNVNRVQLLMQMCIVAVVGYYIMKLIQPDKTVDGSNKTEQNYEKIGSLILILGIVMRVGYMLYTPWYERVHDIGNMDLADSGHASYILHLFEGKLPDSNSYQFYHPPLFHILSAVTMHIAGFLTGKSNGAELFEVSKVVSCLASCGVLFQIRKFLKELNLKEETAAIIMAIIAFLPNFYFLAGRINNDSLVIFFMIMAIRYTYKWCKEQSCVNLIVLAAAYGCGMMTKTSCGTMAVFTGLWMLVVFCKKVKEKKWKPILLQFIVFGCISFPLGLWYQIRNLIAFGQPLNYVHKIEENSPTYIGMHSVWERFFSFGNTHFWDDVYNNPYGDYHLPSYLIKSSVFGEFTFNIEDIVPRILLLCNLLLVILSLAAMVYILVKGTYSKNVRFGLFFIWCIQMYSYLFFNVKFPHGCTMDFRYIVPTAVIGAMYIGMAGEQIKEKNDAVEKVLSGMVTVLVLAFSAASIVMFCNIG